MWVHIPSPIRNFVLVLPNLGRPHPSVAEIVYGDLSAANALFGRLVHRLNGDGLDSDARFKI